MGQSLSFNMDRTYFREGDGIMFYVDYSPSPSVFSHPMLRGPLDGDTQTYHGFNPEIPVARVEHTGTYVMQATFTDSGIVCYDTIFINVVSMGDGYGIDEDAMLGAERADCSCETYPCLGTFKTPAPICEGMPLTPTIPQLCIAHGVVCGGACSSSYEWAPTLNGPWQSPPFNIGSSGTIPASANGTYLRVHYTYPGHTPSDYYSNAVRLTVIPKPSVTIDVDGSEEICPGDSAILYANSDVMDIYLAVGDILCTDWSVVKPSDWPVAGKTPWGIVFYVDDSDSHGWAVGLSQSSGLKWSTINTWVVSANNQTNWRDVIKDMNGAANTGAIRAITGYANRYPAVKWIDDNYNSTTWYLPSAGQLNILYGELPKVNRSLNVVGGMPIEGNGGGFTGSVKLWSSTEMTATNNNAMALSLWQGLISSSAKSSTLYVRPIINF